MRLMVDEKINALAVRHSISEALIGGVLRELAAIRDTGDSVGQIAGKWAIPLSVALSIQKTCRVTLMEMRDGLSSKCLMIANGMQDAILEDMGDPEKLGKISTRDKSTIAKQMLDTSMNLANGHVGAPAAVLNVAEMKILMRREKYVPIREKLAKAKEVA